MTITEQELLSALKTETVMILATCAGNRVTIRPMSHINSGLDIYFQTAADSLKVRQIRDNPMVALCVGTYEIEGTASELGHPLSEENAFFAQSYNEKHPGAFEKYSVLANEILVKVTIHRVRQWRYADGRPFLAERDF